jgi:hypothetical protein
MTMTTLEKILTAAVTALVLAAAPLTLSSPANAGGHGFGGHGFGHKLGGFNKFHGGGFGGGTNCFIFKQTPFGIKKVFICGGH